MYKRGYSPGGEDCTGTYAEAESICARLSVNRLPDAPAEVEYPITDWRLASNLKEAGEFCGTGCNADGQDTWVASAR
eukprot:6012955-Pyramimonas_sp.AAC.1